MGDTKTLSDRIDRLEARLTFQDDAIETLNKTITEQWLKIDALTRQLFHLNERLQEAVTQAPGAAANEPPPHY
jgi:SlyX protein